MSADKKLNDILENGEELLWEGSPSDITALDAEYKPRFVKKIIITLILLIALTIYALMSKTLGVFIVAFFWLVGIFVVTVTFSEVGNLQKLTYAITDKRMIILRDEAVSLPFEAVKNAALVKDAAGKTSLLCGALAAKGSKANARKLAQQACNAKEDVADKFVWYAIPDANRVKLILEEHIGLN